jgi:hypothetical protein
MLAWLESGSKTKCSTTEKVETMSKDRSKIEGNRCKKKESIVDLTDEGRGNYLKVDASPMVRSSVSTVRSGKMKTESGPSSSSHASGSKVAANLVPCLDKRTKNNDFIGDSAPGSLFFSSVSNEKGQPPSNEVTVVPETQIMLPVPRLYNSMSLDSKLNGKTSSKKLVTSDLDDSLTTIPPTPESKPLGRISRKRVQGRSFMLSASNISSGLSGYPGGFKPRKPLTCLKPKGKSSKQEPSAFEGCNYSLTESNREVEKYSDLQMQVLYSAHGMSIPVSMPEEIIETCGTPMDSGGNDGTSAPSVTESKDAVNLKANKPHVVSTKVQKHSDRFGKLVPVPDIGDVSNSGNKFSKCGVKRACAKGTGISPNAKRQTPKQHYGEIHRTKRDLCSEMVWSAAANCSRDIHSHAKHTDAVASDSPVDEVEFEDLEKIENPHKKLSRKRRLQMIRPTAGNNVPDKRSISCNNRIADRIRKKKKDTTLVSPNICDQTLVSDDLLLSIMDEMKCPSGGTSTPKIKTVGRSDAKCDMLFSGLSAVGEEVDRVGVRTFPQDDEDYILSDIIGEIRSYTQATQSHSYDKKLNHKWKELDAKNHSFSAADAGGVGQEQPGICREKLKKDLNTKFPSNSVPSCMSCPSESSHSKSGQNDMEVFAKTDNHAGDSHIVSSMNEVSGTSSKESCCPVEGDLPFSAKPHKVQDVVVIKDNIKMPTKASIVSEGTSRISMTSTVGSQEKSNYVPPAVPDMEYGDFSMDGSWMEHLDLDKCEERLSESFSKFSPFKRSPE